MPGVEQGHPALKLTGAIFAAATRFVQEQPWQQHKQRPRGDPLWGIMLWVRICHMLARSRCAKTCVCLRAYAPRIGDGMARIVWVRMRSSSSSTIQAKWCQPGQMRYAMLGHNALGLRLLRHWGKSWFHWLLFGLGFRRRS